MKVIISISILIILIGCAGESERRGKLDLTKTESRLIPLLNKIHFSSIEITNGLLIVNDTLITSGGENPSKVNRWVSEVVTVQEWSDIHSYSDYLLDSLQTMMIETNSTRIVYESETYFFNEGGWIDANIGKAYSKKENLLCDDYKFDRVKELDLIEGRDNWYEYYAD